MRRSPSLVVLRCSACSPGPRPPPTASLVRPFDHIDADNFAGLEIVWE